MIMAGGSLAPVIAGLTIGSVFILLFLIFSQPSIESYTQGLIDKNNKNLQLDKGNNKLIVDILLQNGTVTHLLKGRDVILSAIADMHNSCMSGSCARVHLLEEGKPSDQMQILVDYTNYRVLQIHYTDGW
jgi:hypothetical protein